LNRGSEGKAVRAKTKDKKVLDAAERYPTTQSIFEKYHEQAGECMCGSGLLRTREEVAAKYSIDLEALLDDINSAASRSY
jgi:hypothetical protein